MQSLILVSNRGPVTFERRGRRPRTITRGGGGLVSALTGLIEHQPALWVSAAITPEDAVVAEEAGGGSFELPGIGVDTRGRFVVLDPETYHAYYNVIANPMLWFIQHYLWDLGNEPIIDADIHRAWNEGYVEVNRQMAAKAVEVARAAGKRPLILIHDYQLYLVPRMVRKEFPTAVIQLFVHVPWPTPQYWKVLPKEMRNAILDGILGCDIVGFQSSLDVRNFLMTC